MTTETKKRSFFRSPQYVFGFLLLLVVPQLIAITSEFREGFRPFKHEPVRVPFSWDMFSNRVERCALEWSPPLKGPEGALASLKQFGTTLEWDVIYDHVDNYRAMGLWLCGMGGPNNGSHVRLKCFLPQGTRIEDDIACR